MSVRGALLDCMDATPAGYDPEFLPIDVALPLALPGRAVRSLTYMHFTVLLDPLRRLAAATAVNIDGAALREVDRADDWHFDSRVPEEEQVGDEVYASNDIDRGHLVRRRDPVWGEQAVAERANEDTFVFTNAAPQAAVFNQSKELWLGLEDYVLGSARAALSRISVFTGPVLDPTDPVYRGVAIPQAFWKVAVWVNNASIEETDAAAAGPSVVPAESLQLAATGYLLDQSPQLDDLELDEARATAIAMSGPPPLGPFRTFQVPIADIAALTGLNLDELTAADRLVVDPGVTAGGRGGWVPLYSTGDIQL